MRYHQTFIIRVLKEHQKYLKQAMFLYNDESEESSLSVQNIDCNQFVTVAVTSDHVLSQTEIQLLIFDFGLLFKDATLIY